MTGWSDGRPTADLLGGVKVKHLRFVVLPTMWIFLVGSAVATSPPPAVMPPRGAEISPVLIETTPVHHVAQRTGPIVVNWHFTAKSPGPSMQGGTAGWAVPSTAASANLIVNPDGTTLYSGNYKQNAHGYTLSVTVALKSNLGGTIYFLYVGDAAHGLQWSKQTKSAFLKDQFKTFVGKHDWAGSYRFELTSKGRHELSAYCQALAKSFGMEWLNTKGKVMFGWSPTDRADHDATCKPLSK